LYAQEFQAPMRKPWNLSYLKHDNLADATRQLANSLFLTYGLVILDADDADLKRPFIPAKSLHTKPPIKQYLKQPKN
jgi:hypothetical protein